MWQPTMLSVSLILTLFLASSASDNSFLLADEILKVQAECDFYIKQTDNAILEGSETFPMNPGVDYFKCVDKLDDLKRQYIRENLLGLSFHPEIFPMRLSNGTLILMSAPAEDVTSELSTSSSDSKYLEELCSMHESCSSIVDHLDESIAKEKSSEANYFKIKRAYCLEILDKLKIKYINDNNLNIGFLKTYGEFSIICKNGITTMSLPESLRSEDNSRGSDLNASIQSKSGDSSISDSRDDKDEGSSSEGDSYKGAYYNEVGQSPIITHKEGKKVKSIPPKGTLITTKITSVNTEEKKRNEKISSVESNDEIDVSNLPEVSKIVKTNEGEVTVRDSVDAVLPVPEVDNTLHSIDNVHSISKSAIDKNTPVLDNKQNEVENVSFYMKATAADYNILYNPVFSSATQTDNINENSNSSFDVKSNQDGDDDSKDRNDGIEKVSDSDDDEGKINDKSNKSDSKVIISSINFKDNTEKVKNDKTAANIDETQLKGFEKDKKGKDSVKNTDDRVIKSDDNIKFENNNFDQSNYKGVNSNDDIKIINEKLSLSLETESITSDSSGTPYIDEDIETGVTVKSDSPMGRSVESLDASSIGNSLGKAEISNDSAENHGGEVVSTEELDDVALVVGKNAKDPEKTNDNSDDNGSLHGSLPAEPQLNLAMDHPPITTATPSPDTLGDELIDREEDCKQLLHLASRLLQYRTASYLDKEYAACVDKLNQMKIQYIKSHSVDIDKYRILFPVTLSDGTERLVQLPPLHRESSTLPNTRSSVFAPHQLKIEQEDMIYDEDDLEDTRVRHRSTSYLNRVQMDNPAFISNKKFLEYFNNQVPPGEASTLSKFANMIYRNVGRSEKKIED